MPVQSEGLLWGSYGHGWHGKITDFIYLDFCKIFDMVPYNILIFILNRHELDGWTVQWIRNWLDGCRQRVVVHVSMSRGRWVMSGVFQGIALGLVLFSVFIKDTQWNRVHLQQVCRWHKAEWCRWHNRRMGGLVEGPGHAWEVHAPELHNVQEI